MGLFDSLSGLAGQIQSLQSSDLAGPVMNELQQQGIGNVNDLVTKMQNSGFGDHVTSWLSGNAQNLPLTPDDVQKVLGSDAVQNLASKLGVDTNQASALLAQHLPAIVRHLSSDGQAQS